MNCVRLLSASFVLAVLFSGCENDLEKVKLYEKPGKGPVESAKNIRLLYSDSGMVKVEVTAPLLERYEAENPYTEMTKGVNASF